MNANRFLRPRLHDAGKVSKRHEKVPFWPPACTMLVEFYANPIDNNN